MLAALPAPDLRVYFVWIPMVDGDEQDRARDWAAEISDPRVRHFWDGDTACGRAFAAVLGVPADPDGGHPPTAWDAYLVYDGGARWSASPPTPAAWMHQLPVMGRRGRRLDGATLRADVTRATTAGVAAAP